MKPSNLFLRYPNLIRTWPKSAPNQTLSLSRTTNLVEPNPIQPNDTQSQADSTQTQLNYVQIQPNYVRAQPNYAQIQPNYTRTQPFFEGRGGGVPIPKWVGVVYILYWGGAALQ